MKNDTKSLQLGTAFDNGATAGCVTVLCASFALAHAIGLPQFGALAYAFLVTLAALPVLRILRGQVEDIATPDAPIFTFGLAMFFTTLVAPVLYFSYVVAVQILRQRRMFENILRIVGGGKYNLPGITCR